MSKDNVQILCARSGMVLCGKLPLLFGSCSQCALAALSAKLLGEGQRLVDGRCGAVCQVLGGDGRVSHLQEFSKFRPVLA